MAGCGVFQRPGDGLGVVLQDAEVRNVRPQSFQKRDDGVAVGVVDAALGRVPARVADLVAGREHCRLQGPVDGYLRASDGGGDADFLGPEPPPGPNDDGTLFDVFAGVAPVRPPFQSDGQDHGIAVFLAVFFHKYRVRAAGLSAIGTGGHRGAGEDAKRLALFGRVAQGVTGGDAARNLEPSFAVGVEIVEIDSIAVDGAVVVGRHVAIGDDIFGQNPPGRMAKGHGFGLRHRAHAVAQDSESIGQRRQLAAESKTIVFKLRHRGLPFPWPEPRDPLGRL